MNGGLAKGIIAIIFVFIALRTCSSCNNDRYDGTPARPQNTALNKVVKSLKDEKNFSVILYDMDTKDPESSNPKYLHQYQLLIEKPDTVLVKETEWYPVSAYLFNEHLNNLGMELISKKDGVLHKEVAPAGYSNYIGNERYGHWTERNGTSFWEFYGRYAFMSSMFNMMTYPVRRSYWYDYHDNYYGRGRGYYGPSGSTVYGTSSYANSQKGKNTTWSKKPNSFKSKVRSKVSRSAAASKRTSRSSSRSSSRTSYRSRSGGFGK